LLSGGNLRATAITPGGAQNELGSWPKRKKPTQKRRKVSSRGFRVRMIKNEGSKEAGPLRKHAGLHRSVLGVKQR